jgi:hypothetical protein
MYEGAPVQIHLLLVRKYGIFFFGTEEQGEVCGKLSHPVLNAKPNALITCAPGSSYTHA